MGKRNGFTLIELSVVISIIGFIFLLSFPTLATFKDRAYLEGDSRLFVSDLRKAQAKAISTGEEQLLDRFKFAKSGFAVPGGSGTLIMKSKAGAVRKIVLSSAGRIRLE